MKTMSLPSAMPFFFGSFYFISILYRVTWIFQRISLSVLFFQVIVGCSFFFGSSFAMAKHKNSVQEFLCKIEGKIYLNSNRTHNRIIYTKHMNVLRQRQWQCFGENNTHSQVLYVSFSSSSSSSFLLFFSFNFYSWNFRTFNCRCERVLSRILYAPK